MEHLVDLGPFTVKSILHHIFSRKEFRLDTGKQTQMVHVLGDECNVNYMCSAMSAACAVHCMQSRHTISNLYPILVMYMYGACVHVYSMSKNCLPPILG